MKNEIRYIWIISDGKQGHLNQSLGLAEALQRRHPKTILQILPLRPLWHSYKLALQTRQEQSIPSIIIAAGHSTHLSLIVLAKILHVPSIVLMKPSFPLCWFDLCLIPEHDSPPIRNNIITTIGAINRVQPSNKQADTGLFLIGGPSKYFGWDDNNLIEQINHIIKQQSRHWILTTSRRTPDKTVKKLKSIVGIDVIPSSETDIDWLPNILAKTEMCYVTQDSVSMIYEALTAGCQLGLLHTPELKNNHLSVGINKLQQLGYIKTAHSQHIHKQPLAEADRCATLIEERFLQ